MSMQGGGGGPGGRWGGGGRGRRDRDPEADREARLPSSRLRFKSFRKRLFGRKPEATDAEKPNDRRDKPSKGIFQASYLKAYFTWLRPFSGGLVVVFLLALVGVGLNSAKPIFVQQIIDNAILGDVPDEEKFSRLHFWGMTIIIVAAIGVVVDGVRNFVNTTFTAKVTFRLRQRLHDHLMKLSLGDLSEMKSGGVVARLSGDVDSTTNLVQSAIIGPAVALLQAIVATTIIFIWNWRLAMGIMIIAPPLVLLHLVWVRRIRPIYRSVRDDRSRVDGRVTETFGGIRVVRAFRRESRERSNYAVGHDTAIRKRIYARLLELVVNSGWGMLMPALTAVIMWYGGYLIIRDAAAGVEGGTTIGQLFMFQWYLFLVLSPILAIVNALSSTQVALAATERVFDVLDLPEDKPDKPDAVNPPARVERMTFENVSFAYRPETPVLQQLNLDIPGGSVVALVGPSGAGKTTFTDLVARFQDPTEGAIRLNGTDLRDFKLHAYRSMFGVVQQDVFLFDGTVRENIAYGRRGATEAEIIDAARRANAHDFIVEMPEGYDTIIGERGFKVSGGQRQRLSIARAILADPQILILDEATSNLDTESEQLIQQALKELYANRTTFVIAHRLSTIRHADLIVVLEGGVVVETGRHDELMAHAGRYRDMIERQQYAMADERDA